MLGPMVVVFTAALVARSMTPIVSEGDVIIVSIAVTFGSLVDALTSAVVTFGSETVIASSDVALVVMFGPPEVVKGFSSAAATCVLFVVLVVDLGSSGVTVVITSELPIVVFSAGVVISVVELVVTLRFGVCSG